MKGVVFTEFLELVEDKFSADTVDDIIEMANLPTGGVYAATGTYDYDELVALVGALSKVSEMPVPTLLQVFGEHLFGRFHDLYPSFFDGATSSIDFLPQVDGYIHGEVRKLYPDAELPKFECDTSAPGKLVMEYSSKRPLAEFAKGLIQGCIKHFEEDVALEHEDLSGGKGTDARFTLIKQAG